MGITAVTPATSSDLDGLYRELQPELVRYAEGMLGNRADAEEAVQDAFLAATRVSANGAPGFAEARPWLYRVTRNASIDRIRRRKLSVAIEDVAETQPSEDVSLQHAAELSVDLEVLRIGLDRLGEQQRSALVLRELSGLAYADIAEVLGVSESNVKVLIFRARKSLQALADAADLDCDDAQLALSARHDGECGRGEGARARLHAATCRSCRRFERAISTQATGLAALFPLAAVGLKTGGTLGGLFGAKAAAVAAATVALVGGGGARRLRGGASAARSAASSGGATALCAGRGRASRRSHGRSTRTTIPVAPATTTAATPDPAAEASPRRAAAKRRARGRAAPTARTTWPSPGRARRRPAPDRRPPMTPAAAAPGAARAAPGAARGAQVDPAARSTAAAPTTASA